MSLHPEILGFQLDKLFGLFGSGDAVVLKDMTKRIDKLSRSHDETFRETMKDTLETAINSGVPVTGLKTEGDPHVLLADLLARRKQKPIDTESYDWKIGAFDAFDQACGKQLGKDGRRLFQYFLKGRPIFGQQIKGSVYYGYLTGEEADVLMASMQEINAADPMAAELATTFIEWMEMIRPKQDIWFHVG